MQLLSTDIERYVAAHTSPESTVLQALTRETHLKTLMPRMLSGHLQGAWLRMVSQMIRPHRILEIGTFTGYSAICLCAGLAPNGILHTIDINEELEELQRRYFETAQLSDRIQLHIGDAVAIIPRLPLDPLDLVFIDADKQNYSRYYDLVFDRVRPGGFIIADNVLWSGKVLDEDKPDKDTRALQNFNDKVQRDNRVENLLLPIRDGLMMLRKVG